MTDFLARNLSVLAELDPELALAVEQTEPPGEARLITAKSGRPTVMIQGVSLHSRFDPEAEGQKFASPEELETLQAAGRTPAVFGLGLGYHVLALAEACERVVVIEPDPGLIRLALTHTDFRPVFQRLKIFSRLPEDPPAEKLHVLPHAPSVRLHRAEFENWLRWAGGLRETVGHLAQDLCDIPELSEVLAGLDPEAPAEAGRVAREIRARSGPPLPGEIFLLLLAELSSAGDRLQP